MTKHDFESIIRIIPFLTNDKLMEKINQLDEHEAGALICMLIEEYCYHHKIDSSTFARDCYQTIFEVNMEEGRYNKDAKNI